MIMIKQLMMKMGEWQISKSPQDGNVHDMTS